MIKKIFTVGVVVLTITWAVGLAAFVPTAQATAFGTGDLIKMDGNDSVYYYGADGYRYVFPNLKTYNTWYPDFSTVITVTEGELQAITMSANVTYRPGVKLIKITTDPTVYAVGANGTLRAIDSESVASALYGAEWASMIDDVPDSFFFTYTVLEDEPIMSADDFDVSGVTASATSINVDKGLAGGEGGTLSISLASDTPGSQTVSTGASADMTKVTFSAGGEAVAVKSAYITRSGLTNNSNITNIKLVNADGSTVGSVGSLNTNSKALITFVPTLNLAANTSVSYWIRASIDAGAVAGSTVALGFSSPDDIVLEAGTATGAFPVVGNYMSIVNLAGTIGQVNVGQQGGNAVDTQPDAGDERVLVAEFYVQGGANEDLTLESLGFSEAGSANTSDSANIELYSLTEARSLGTVSAWDANSSATFSSLDVVIPKGAKHIFQVYLDVIGGSGQSIDVDLTDGGDVMLTVKGNTYGFYLTPTVDGGWDGQGISGVNPDGQSVNSGILNVSKSTDSPAAGNITQATEQSLTTWDFEVRGESTKIDSTMVTLTLGGSLAVADLNNARLYDGTGTLVAGPLQVTVVVNPTTATVTFTDTYIVPTGTHTFTFVLDILNTAPNNGTISASIAAPATDINASGMSTNDDAAISTAAANGNTQTILGVALNAKTLTQPAARNLSVGSQDFVFATASLDASASGEDVRVSSVTVTDTVAFTGRTILGNTVAPATVVTTNVAHGLTTGDTVVIAGSNSTPVIDGSRVVTVLSGTTFSIPVTVTGVGTAGTYYVSTTVADFTSLANLQVWADLTDSDSARGDAFETQVSNTAQPVAGVATKAIGLSQTITVPVGTFVEIAIVADVSTAAATLIDHSLKVSALTATGKSTGNVPGVNYTGAGQAMTITGAGTLSLILASTNPDKQILLGSSTDITVAQFELYASNVEDLDLDDVLITDSVGAGVVNTWYLYTNYRSDGGSTSDPIGMTSGGTTAQFVFADGTVVIPANTTIKLTVKADIVPVEGVTVANGAGLQAQTMVGAFDVNATGLSSGLQTQPAFGAVNTVITHVAYNAAPEFSLNTSLSPANDSQLSLGADTLLAVFDVKALNDKVTFVAGQDQLTVEVSAFCTGGGGAGNAYITDGSTQLDTSQVVNLCAGADLVFDFDLKTLGIDSGSTSQIYVYGDTSGFITGGDSIKVWLDDGGAAGDLQWSINSAATSYDEADVIYRSDIKGPNMVRNT